MTATDSETTVPPAAPAARSRSVALDVLRVDRDPRRRRHPRLRRHGHQSGHPRVGKLVGRVVVDIGNVWVIPVFVMVSGALVLGPRAHAAGPRAFYRKRAASGWARRSSRGRSSTSSSCSNGSASATSASPMSSSRSPTARPTPTCTSSTSSSGLYCRGAGARGLPRRRRRPVAPTSSRAPFSRPRSSST